MRDDGTGQPSAVDALRPDHPRGARAPSGKAVGGYPLGQFSFVEAGGRPDKRGNALFLKELSAVVLASNASGTIRDGYFIAVAEAARVAQKMIHLQAQRGAFGRVAPVAP